MGRLTLEQKGRLTGLIDAGMTIRDVAHELGCNKDKFCCGKRDFNGVKVLRNYPESEAREWH